ncbi:MAG: thioredoxin family protein [Ideonella sp.]|nr:thioredoxin family protein [Ideonella sp.]
MKRSLTRVWAVAALLLGAAAAYLLREDAPLAPLMPQVQASVPAVADPVTQVLAAGKPSVIEFGANTCISCREMKPILADLQAKHGERIAVADFDILKNRELISRYQIRLMPTQVFFDAQGRETSRHMGKISGDEILARLGLTAEQP